MNEKQAELFSYLTDGDPLATMVADQLLREMLNDQNPTCTDSEPTTDHRNRIVLHGPVLRNRHAQRRNRHLHNNL